MERFTKLAEECIYTAHRLVSDQQQQRMEAEHLLLALVELKDGMMPVLLERLHIKIKQLGEELLTYIQKLEKSQSENKDVYLSYSSEQIIRKAEHEADRMRDEFVGPEHILLGILAHSGTEASRYLKNYNVSNDQISAIITQEREGKRITSRGEIKESEVILEYCQDLVNMAKNNRFDPVIGRDEEVRRVIQVLSRRTKNNPVLIGEPGVGKTAIIEGLAQRIYLGDIPETLKESSLLSLDLASMVAGAKYRGEFEDRLKNLLKAIENSPKNIILFIDELHTLIGAGASEGTLDASNMLKPALARGFLHCVGATTINEFKKYIERDSALERRFQQVYVPEPSVEDCIGILRGLKGKYEVHHGVRIKDSAIIASAKLANRYITDRYLPDKAIDLIDEAASTIRIEIDSMPTALDQISRKMLQLEIERKVLVKEEDEESKKRLWQQDQELDRLKTENNKLKIQWKAEREAIQKIQKLKEEIEKTKANELDAQRSGNLELAAKLKYGTQDKLEKELQAANELMNKSSKQRLLKEEVDEEDIARAVSKWTGIPVTKMLMKEQEKLLNMEKVLSEKLVGQKYALSSVSNAIRRSRTGIQDPNRPLGSFVFMGPTGVGKTELAKVLASFLFDDEKAMIRLDMTEYMEKHTVSRLLGAPPGYVGFDEGGILTEAVHRKPYSVILFDEIEKGHPEIFHILLQILDDGILTDSRGIKVDFKNTIIILTTNMGSEMILKLHEENKRTTGTMSRKILLTRFRPELLNRLDEIIIFNPLSMEDIEQLVKIQVDALTQRLKQTNTFFKVTQEAQKHLAQIGFDREFGARPLKRVIQKELEDVLAYKILDGTIKPDDFIEIRVQDQNLTFHRIKTTEPKIRN